MEGTFSESMDISWDDHPCDDDAFECFDIEAALRNNPKDLEAIAKYKAWIEKTQSKINLLLSKSNNPEYDETEKTRFNETAEELQDLIDWSREEFNDYIPTANLFD